MITAEGAADPKKFEAVWLQPFPKGYHRVKWISCHRRLVKPLTLLKKDTFHGDKETRLAFEELKAAAITALLILAVLDFLKQFVMETDASGTELDVNRNSITT